ncbi:MAG: protein phosphatase 2C domain-containing protein [Proteobacteria bacterium]|nr:protein phosphatase 2C domain-containing protein [Pseudomonadota bacterium]
MKVQAVGKSDVGSKRKINEDKFLVAPELGLYIVADGMGGHKAGEVASGMLVETMADYWRKVRSGNPPPFLMPFSDDLSECGRHLLNSINLANTVIHEAQKRPQYRRMGSTVCAMLVDRDCLWAANVGDSAIYLLDHGRLIEISEEHSVTAEQRSMGLNNALSSTSPFLKNVLTRVLGVKESVNVHINPVRPEVGDLILMCSDGLTNYVPGESIRAILNDATVSNARKVDIFIEEAYRGGGGDNITVILLEVMKEGKWDNIKRRFRRKC